MAKAKVLNQIEIKGAHSNNLQHIDVIIPKNQLVVVTGVSGSGKSSLIIDTLYAEGQRRYVESLSSYARQFLHRMKKPEVDYIKGLCPAIAIEQKVISSNARSTVGSMTEIYDFLRLLFAKIGKTYSPVSGQEVRKNEVKDIVDFILSLKNEDVVYLVFPLQKQYAERSLAQEFDFLTQKGFTRIWKEGELLEIQEYTSTEKTLDKYKLNSPEADKYRVVVDRFKVQSKDVEFSKRVADSIQTVLAEGHGSCHVIINQNEEKVFSTSLELDGIRFLEPSPALFNYNNSYGACPKCEGYGRIIGLDENKVIPNPSKSIYSGAIACWTGEKSEDWLKPLLKVAHQIDFPIHKPYHDLSNAQKDLLWEGKDSFAGINAFFKDLEEKSYKIQNRIMLARYRGRTACTVCKGGRLRPEAGLVKVDGRNFKDMMFVPVEELLDFFQNIKITESEREIAKRILVEIINRLSVLNNIGLSYLTLDRLANSLSGGESQRIHLTRTLGSNLCSSLYILDEPSIGLHPKDTARLVEVLLKLRDLGNTVIVIEHEEEIIRQADSIVDIGPRAGIHGGNLEFSGSYQDFITKSMENLTASYLTGFRQIELPAIRRKQIDFLNLSNAQVHNLKQIEVKFPLNNMICVTGVSGSGKTTLVKHLLYPLLQGKLEDTMAEENLMGAELNGPVKLLQQVEMVSQQGIGRSTRSNPATYVKAYDDIRDIYKNQQLSKIRGYMPKHFSFNVEGGRCEACKGDGEIVVEMQFLADVTLLCEDCNGKRFKNEILEVTYKEKNINEILNLSIEEALDFFRDKKDIVKKLKPLDDVGLGYLKLGQSSSTLSGGEAQRLKLAFYLGLEDSSQHIFFIFDEPTTGLHFDDIRKLLFALHGLVEKGHTVLVIEHNIEVIKTADWLIDLGPGGGKHGGQLLYQGPPEGLIKVKNSYTAQYLKEKIENKS
ncbi:MAG: excinuclease ABC subunit UvrA [Saprospiraceae bacterium]|nr:excinuclease ABC subunit UvrA [Candidatus Vicinibacter proximus]MBL7824603.1 excinuclease ABC subunit UvrA [Saprospiraceae bacterium]MCC6844075.1 excinuclease ABC subunit UvrA [Saprospiraceae bacterium]HRG32496.1 excinuclease ABC subunit UvrA [Saprospiraceae bacterium]